MIRACSKELENCIGEEILVLDHGFVRVVDYMGNDNAIVQSARVSYGDGTTTKRSDAGLIRYLMRHSHTTPFEMCEIKFHIRAPMFVARQWLRHRTANVNEYSARYSILKDKFYIPKDIELQSETNKQGRSGCVSDKKKEEIINIFREKSSECYKIYEEMLEDGVSREIARMILPVNVYTEWYWKIDLHNLLHFVLLRADSHAQYEIREYATVILNLIKKWVPETYNAFKMYKEESVNFSSKQLDVIRKMISGMNIQQEDSDLSKREFVEMMDVIS